MVRKTRSYLLGLIILLISISSIYLHTQVETIYGGDAGDLVSAIITSGIAHPPGYPLYTILGIDLTRIIPLGTYAWKAAFLSSLSSIIALLLLYDLLFLLSRKVIFALISCLFLAFLYPIWLYSIVVEVFALNNLFTVYLIWSLYNFYITSKAKYLYLAAFGFGLSLTHHHIILFLVPMMIYLLMKAKLKFSYSRLFTTCILFLTGLIPYSYTIVAAYFNPALNWQGQPYLNRFIELVTRAGYGSFRAGSFIAHEPILRLINIWAFFDFVYKDFRIAGIIFIITGIFFLRKVHPVFFNALSIGLVSYLFFLFYASFPLVENFLVGTFERFISPLYVLLIFILCFGMEYTLRLVSGIVSDVSKNKRIGILLMNSLPYVLFLLPAGVFILNYSRMQILKKDFTAENLGKDILNSVDSNSILIISTDTPLFDTQYVYYSDKKWPDIKLIHFTKLFTPYYNEQIRKWYPALQPVKENNSPLESFQSFLDDNYSSFPIYSKVSFTTRKGVWIPYGLVFRYYHDDDVPKADEIAYANKKLWASYQDPLSGSLAKYKHLMLTDQLKIYSIASQEIGFYLARSGLTDQAEGYLIQSQRYFDKDIDSYKILSQVYILQKRCADAQKQIDQIHLLNPEDTGYYFISALNYAACWKDREKASHFQKLYEQKQRTQETPLKQL